MICWLKQTRWTLIGIVLAGLVTDARALDPNRLPSQYVREQWTTETRFPGGVVNGIAQTTDGYLWIGTDRGLIRFDGFNFRPVSFTSIAIASNVSILQLLTDAGGKLWIRPQGADIVSQKDGKFESVRYGSPAITALSKDNHDGVLVSDIEQGTFRFTADNVQKLGPSSPPVISMAETADGKVWMGTLGDGLVFLTGGRATNVNAGLPDRKINCLLPISNEELWVGTDTGLYHGNGNGFRRLELPSFLGNVQVLSLLRDRDSNLWVGTTRGLAVHELSTRGANAFVKLNNCAAIPTGLLESELFGHERSAFTGAIAQRLGRPEVANHGTAFLDEIGEIPLELQPKLLRVLQEREFERLGSTRTLHSDARLIAATHRNLAAMVEEQKFRSDLFSD